MPYILTHFYTAARVAQILPETHEVEAVADIRTGIKKWLAANSTFTDGAKNAIDKNNGSMMQNVMDQYRNTILTDESIAIFSAFAAGSQGPDLWTITHSVWDAVNDKIVTGSAYFDLGHYNLSHRFPIQSLTDLKKNGSKLSLLQKKYRTAYILGYLTHIALDIHSHLKVNVFAPAYFQNPKGWETEQTSDITDWDIFDPLAVNIPIEGIPAPFNNHNKIEQYLDTLVRYVLFEGYHENFKPFHDLQTAVGHTEFWAFPNYKDYWDKYLKFGLIIKTNGIYNSDETFLNLSTSLAGPFAHHYDKDSPIKVDPFIRDYMFNAYHDVLSNKIEDNDDISLTDLETEEPKLHFFRMTNRDWVTSFYYNLNVVTPDIKKTLEYTKKFYNYYAFGEFIKGSISLANHFVSQALTYLSSSNKDPDEKVDGKPLHHLKNWNLDTGLSYRIRKPADSASNEPVRIDLISSMGYPALTSWKPPELTAGARNSNQQVVEWTVPKAQVINQPLAYTASVKVSKGQKVTLNVKPQLTIQIGITHNRLYTKPAEDPDEIGVFLFGSNERVNDAWVMDTEVEYEGHKVPTPYTFTECFEDFSGSTGSKTTKADRKNGNVRLRDHSTVFHGKDITTVTNSNDPAQALVPKKRVIPRHVRLSLCRKWVCKANDTRKDEEFHPDLHNCYKSVFPSEEVTFSLYAVVEKEGKYVDIFHDCTFTKEQIDSVKKLLVIGVNSIVLIFKNTSDVLELVEAYIDGEEQDLTKVPEDDYGTSTPAPVTPGTNPPTPQPPVTPQPPADNSCNLLELEDVLFRTDSAVFLPDGYTDRTVYDSNQEVARGFKAISLAYKHAEQFDKQKVFITAHTDTAGSAKYNFDLSVDRALSLQYLLEFTTSNREKWAAVANNRNHKKDIQTICKWFALTKNWDCDPGKIDGAHGDKTRTAVVNLKKEFNKQPDFGRTVPEVPTIDKETWGVVYDLYQKEIAKKCNSTYNQMLTKSKIWEKRWAKIDRKSIGCCEAFPKEQPDRNDFECPINRRVEILFFGESKIPEPLCSATTTVSTQDLALARYNKCKSECKIYKELRASFTYIS
jgi:outer membrane protein OmpA-like peptidoglycan-associated protein